MGILDELDRLLDRAAERGADFVEQESYDRKCLPVIRLQSCISWAKKKREEFPQSAAFLISVKKNTAQKNENDRLAVTLAMLDAQNQPVRFDEIKGVSTVVYTKTVDERLLTLLNGTDSAILKF